MPRTCALILPFLPTMHQVSCINERIQNAPKHYKTHQNMSLRSNGWIGFVRCQKFRCNFMARTFALIAPVQPVLHRVLCSNEIIRNAPKYYEPHQNMSLGSNRVDWVRSLPKIMIRVFELIALVQPVLHEFRVVTEHCQMHPYSRNTPNHE